MYIGLLLNLSVVNEFVNMFQKWTFTGFINTTRHLVLEMLADVHMLKKLVNVYTRN